MNRCAQFDDFKLQQRKLQMSEQMSEDFENPINEDAGSPSASPAEESPPATPTALQLNPFEYEPQGDKFVVTRF